MALRRYHRTYLLFHAHPILLIFQLKNMLKLINTIFILTLIVGTLKGEKLIPADLETQDASLINIGIIGARVKTDHREERHPRSNSSSAIVKYIFENSLAEGKLKIDDEIIAVNRKNFSNNFTKLLAEELDKSEGSSGRLELQVIRNKKKVRVRFKLERIGGYSDTWPYDCKKSSTILRNACDWLVKHQQRSGRIEKNENQSCLVLSSVTGLALLGCDADEYKRPISKIVKFLTNHIKEKTNSNGHYDGGILDLWSVNYATIFLAEYYLKTGDEKVMETLKFLNKEIYYRQFHQMTEEVKSHLTNHLVNNKGFKHDPAPPYWFAHGLVDTKSNGYVHLGVNVANATIAWSLLDKAGVDVDTKNLTATLDYVEKACVSGAMGYASYLNQQGHPSDAFGRTGALGIALHLRKDRPAYTQVVTNSLIVQYPKNYYFSHATCVMGKAWGTLAIAALDKKHFRTMMDDMKGDFDLMRLHDGSFVSNPAMKNDHGPMDMTIGGSGERHRWTTAFNALIYTLAKQNLTISSE